MKKIYTFLTIILMVAMPALGAENSATTLDALLEHVKQAQIQGEEINREREKRFLAEKNRQEEMLRKARVQLKREEQLSNTLNKRIDANEKKLAEMEMTLQQRMGTLGEMFGMVRQVAGDLLVLVNNSLVSAQYPGRGEFLDMLSQSKELPNIEQLEQLWFVLQQEMTESGKVVKFRTNVVTPNGESHEADVTRVGVFTAVSKGKFLHYLSESKKFVSLPRQPGNHSEQTASQFEQTTRVVAPMVLDPTRGTILDLIAQKPAFLERIQQGGIIGYVIIGLGIVGFLIGLFRFVYLSIVGKRMYKQMRNILKPNPENPLGRVISAYEKHKTEDIENVEINLDEAVLKEIPMLKHGQDIIKLFAAAAPLLGLLGTVTGMIGTFQAITLFGTGDPKLMASGISQALVTTMLGLTVAIPLLFIHCLIASRSKVLIQILEEQSAGLVAKKTDRTEE
ncbi:MAG: MotA/TolQ/ExbB proton channel family protein [Desulfobacteraceae bacterium]|nr:MotA/TolQ/ExbB proton channel family protein [Desulfobacteraceae bacterium]MBC2719281.1 MotA/TolQ/ExbB proton channel family protein [Desulfobacteraceae bacterium]